MESTAIMMPWMKEEEKEDDIGSMSSFSDHDDSSNSVSSLASSSEVTEDASSSNSSISSSFQSESVSANDQFDKRGPLFEMSDLISDLPIKRSLSKFFEGKSQSFTSLSNAINLEDLIKPERPYNVKRMKNCKSYAGGLDRQKSLSPKHPTKGAIMKKSSSKGSFGSLGSKKRSFLGFKSSMAPTTPRSSHCLSNQALLFA